MEVIKSIIAFVVKFITGSNLYVHSLDGKDTQGLGDRILVSWIVYLISIVNIIIASTK